MTDLGYLKYFVNTEIAWNNKRYFLFQMKFSSDATSSTRDTYEKLVDTRKAIGVKMKIDDGKVLENLHPFYQLIEALTYLSIAKSYISHIIHTVKSVST